MCRSPAHGSFSTAADLTGAVRPSDHDALGMSATHAQRKALGDLGESLAAEFLTASGYSVIERNWRCPDGEIDILALDGSTVVVCEVKTRSSTRYGTPLEAITPAKAARLYRLAAAWRRAHQVRAQPMRIDVVTVLRTGNGRAEIEHLKDVA
jgi:putative endonuclease